MSEFENQIKKCETLKQIFDVVNYHYNTDEPMGIATGALVKAKINKLVKVTKLKKR